MIIDDRLAEVFEALRHADVPCLVMGGHAVRFYGLARGTVDCDVHVSPECWADLEQRLRRSRILAGRALSEGPSWRPADFRRFRIGTLPDGREEWLDIWLILA